MSEAFAHLEPGSGSVGPSRSLPVTVGKGRTWVSHLKIPTGHVWKAGHSPGSEPTCCEASREPLTLSLC